MAEAEKEVFCGLMLPLQEQIAVNRNNRMMAKWNLRHLCLKVVVKNREIFTNVGPNSAHRVEDLPLVLRNDLMKMANEMWDRESISSGYLKLVCNTSVYESYCRLMARLLQDDTAALNLPLCMDVIHKSSVEKLLEDEVVGSDNCRFLRLINVNVDFYYDMEDEVLDENYLYVHAFFRALPRLPHLQVVNLGPGWFIEDHQLEEFAKHTPNLVVLIVAGLDDQITCAGFEALSKLPHFRKFIFVSNEDLDFELEIAVMCARFLPKLKIAGSNYSDLNFNFLELRELDDGSFHKPILQTPQPVPLGLEQILVTGNVKPHQSCQLPDLKTLIWMKPIGDVLGFCNHFSTITELTLLKADVGLLMDVLQGVGRRLQKLQLGHAPRALPLSQILQCCPNLEYLKIEFCTFEAWARWPAKNFCIRLEEIVLDMQYQPLPRGFIAKLLGAPLLNKLYLSNTCLSKYEVDDLLALTHQRRILGSIVKFDWFNGYMEKGKQKEWMADKDQFNLLLENLQVAFPHLDTINYVKRSHEEDAELEAEYEQILYLNEDEVKEGQENEGQ